MDLYVILIGYTFAVLLLVGGALQTRGRLRIVLGTVLTLLLATGVYAWISMQWSIPHYMVALQIPRYPNRTSWDISSDSGFLGGSDSAKIVFTSEDAVEDVEAFYERELPEKGWLPYNPRVKNRALDKALGDQELKGSYYQRGRIFKFEVSINEITSEQGGADSEYRVRVTTDYAL